MFIYNVISNGIFIGSYFSVHQANFIKECRERDGEKVEILMELNK